MLYAGVVSEKDSSRRDGRLGKPPVQLLLHLLCCCLAASRGLCAAVSACPTAAHRAAKRDSGPRQPLHLAAIPEAWSECVS